MDESLSQLAKIGLVIFAHNESDVIGKSIESIIKTMAGGDEIMVIADNCTDDTVQVALQAGAIVFRRENGKAAGKGAALAWFVKNYWSKVNQFARIVILDADSTVSSDYVDVVRSASAEDKQVMQCFVQPIEYEHSPVSVLIALSELVEQTVFNRLKTFFQYPVRLRGTGMVISPEVLRSVYQDMQTDVEDIALTLLITAKKLEIQPLNSAIVYDPKPQESAAATRQRARWFRGQWTAFWWYRETIFRILLQGPRGISLIGTVFLKPRWLKMTLSFILAIMFLNFPVVAGVFGLFFSFDLFLILLGIWKLDQKKAFSKALYYVPGFILMWVKSILLSFQRIPWLRVRENTTYTNPTRFNQPRYVSDK
jgi:cellulose synthase/poly-beta-1,6-N-acetylglucosamine synthase-like glycosyltransferase